MNAPHPPSLAERILAAITGATGQHPARADAVAAALDLAPNATAFTDALAELDREHRINCATIQRLAVDPAPWLAIWPTGLAVDSGAWTANGHRALFVRHTPLRQALHDAAAPRVSTPPAKEKTAMPATHIPAPKPRLNRRVLQQQVLQLLIDADTALSCAELAERTGRSAENMRLTCKKLVEQGLALLDSRPGGKRGTLQAFRAVITAPGAPAPREDALFVDVKGVDVDDFAAALERKLTPEETPTPEEEPSASYDGYRYDPGADPDPATRFALWDNGTLDIVEPDRVLRLARPDVARLALLLGVPAN